MLLTKYLSTSIFGFYPKNVGSRSLGQKLVVQLEKKQDVAMVTILSQYLNNCERRPTSQNQGRLKSS